MPASLSKVRTYAEEYNQANERGGFFNFLQWEVISIEGPDAREYLQRMSTVNFKTWTGENPVPGAFLTGRGHVVVLGTFVGTADRFDFIVDPGMGATALDHIEKFHFAEKFSVKDSSHEWALFGLWNSSDRVAELLNIPALTWPALTWNDPKMADLLWVRVSRPGAEALIQHWKSCRIELLGERVFEWFRIQAGLPRMGKEIRGDEIILETGFEEAVARNKGCYPGQEVVERIFTYGQVNRKLMLVRLEKTSTEWPSPPLSLAQEGKPSCQLMSLESSPTHLDRAYGLAYLNKAYWEQQEIPTCLEGVKVYTVR